MLRLVLNIYLTILAISSTVIVLTTTYRGTKYLYSPTLTFLLKPAKAIVNPVSFKTDITNEKDILVLKNLIDLIYYEKFYFTI